MHQASSRSDGSATGALNLLSKAPALAVLATPAGLAAAQGGYFAPAWGWATLILLWAAGVHIVIGGERPSLPELLFAAGVGGYAALAGLSGLWSSAPGNAVSELQRGLLYAVALAAAAIVFRRRDAQLLLLGLVAVVTGVSAYALVTRLFQVNQGEPDPVAAYRLAEPIGYWNALGIFAAIGIVLAIGLAHESSTRSYAAIAAGAPPLLASTVYFTFGRGAWLATAFGVAVLMLATTRRLQLVATLGALIPWAAAAVLLASRSNALARPDRQLASAADDGRVLAAVLVALCAGSVLSALALSRVKLQVTVPRKTRLAVAVLLALVVVASAVFVVVRVGSPAALVRDVRERFETRLSDEAPADPNTRLFVVAGNGRPEQWRVALEVFRDHPWLGSGAGTYQREWVQRRPRPFYVRDAHSLYLETAGELGLTGLLVLGGALLIPLLVASRARGRPLLATATGGYAAYLLHAGLDWDWEMPVVTMAGLLCAAGVLLVARSDAPSRLGAPFRRVAAVCVTAIAVFAVIGWIGNSAILRSEAAAEAGRLAAAEADARVATRWAPWSPSPWSLLGRAQLGRGDRASARSSFQKATEADDGDWQLWAWLALASDGPARGRALEQATRLNPLGDVESEVGRND